MSLVSKCTLCACPLVVLTLSLNFWWSFKCLFSQDRQIQWGWFNVTEPDWKHVFECDFCFVRTFYTMHRHNDACLVSSRIQPLSEALDDLYKEFNALKAHLGDLTEKFTAVETFIDELKARQATAPAPGPAPAAPVPRQPGRRIIKKKAPPTPS